MRTTHLHVTFSSDNGTLNVSANHDADYFTFDAADGQQQEDTVEQTPGHQSIMISGQSPLPVRFQVKAPDGAILADHSFNGLILPTQITYDVEDGGPD